MTITKGVDPFGKVEGAFVITIERGVYRQVDLYERKGKAFAKQKGGFISIMDGGKTSVPSVAWKDIGNADLILKPKGWYGQVEVKNETE